VSLLAPLAGVFGLAIPAVVALYFLRVRRRPVPVSSTLLWRRMLKDRQANVPWQRLRFSWLLLLQVLAAAALVLALMRPAAGAPAPLAAHTIVMVDTSATMQATDVHPSRFAVAKAKAQALISRLGPQDRMTLMDLSSNPRVLADTVGNKAPLRSALDALTTNDGGADLQQAFALAASVSGSGTDTQVILLSDGITDPLEAAVELPFRLLYQPIGASPENLAITALSAEPGSSGQVGFLHVQNFGRERHSTEVDFSVDGRLADARSVTLGPGSGQDLIFPLPAGARQLSATLSPHDAFALDDSAWAVVRPAGGYRALLVTGGDVFLQQALSLVPGVSLSVVTPTAYPAQPPADLYVFDKFLPAVLPSAPVLLIDPPSGAAGPIGDAFAPGPLQPAIPNTGPNPLLADVSLAGVHVAVAHDLTRSGFGQPLITSPGGPLVLLRDQESGSPRGVLIGFDLHDSDLPLRSAFPILIERLTGWLLPQVSQPSYSPGDVVPIPATGGSAGVLTPGGSLIHLNRAAGSGVPPVFIPTRPGVYEVVRLSGTRGGRRRVLSRFAVDVFSPQLSAIAPVPELNVVTGGGVPPAQRRREQEEWWPWAAGAALILLSAEWVVFHRGL
jgi:Ca-activated chloride channel family protein